MSIPTNAPNILIAGLGNELLMDDGVGVYAARALMGRLPANVQAAEVGTAVLHSLHLIEWADRIIAVDAVQSGKAAGEIVAFDSQGAFAPQVMGSMHELSLVGALRFLTDNKLRRIVVVGVEPERIDYGMGLSPSVNKTLPALIETVSEIAQHWAGIPMDSNEWIPESLLRKAAA